MKKSLFAVVALVAVSSFAEVPFKIGIAGYTFCKKPLKDSLAIMQKIDCHYLCHKDFFLKYDANDKEIAAYKEKISRFGVKTLATGPLYAKDEATARAQFEFAKRLGIKILVGVPYEVKKGAKDTWGANRLESDKMLDIIEKLVKEYDMYYAIHNHGPDIPNLFPTAESAIKRIANRDRRIGVCLDVGHERRAGFDPVVFIRKYADRIFDVHIKNIKIDPVKNIAKEGPRGELDIPAIFQALADVGYSGVCHIEYEKDFNDNAMGLAESFGYYRGVAACIKYKATGNGTSVNADN
jgi:sugar phosphate isomerase/epimerase